MAKQLEFKMTYWDEIKREKINGFIIVFSVTPESVQPDWEFENDQDRQDTLRRIEKGDLEWFVARMQAYKNGILLSSAYLGGCCYPSYIDFTKDGYYDDMVETVINEARMAIIKLIG